MNQSVDLNNRSKDTFEKLFSHPFRSFIFPAVCPNLDII